MESLFRHVRRLEAGSGQYWVGCAVLQYRRRRLGSAAMLGEVRTVMSRCIGLVGFLAMTAHGVAATRGATQKILMTYWSDDTARFVASPMPGSINQAGTIQGNGALLRQM